MDGPFFVDTRAPHLTASLDSVSVTLSTTNKAIVPISNLPVLGSNYFGYIGKAVRMTMLGRITTAATPGNGQFNLYLGSGVDATGTIILASPTFALTASQTNITWQIQCWVRCRAVGGSGVGSLMATGTANFAPAVVASSLQPLLFPASAPTATTVDLTVANFLSPQFLRSGSTAETMTVHEFLFESLN
jgi:hypothetical protein